MTFPSLPKSTRCCKRHRQSPRSYRQEIAEELIADEEDSKMMGGTYLDYARTEKELKERIRKQLVRVIGSKSRLAASLLGMPSSARKFLRFGKSVCSHGKHLSSIRKIRDEHYLCMHVLKAMAKAWMPILLITAPKKPMRCVPAWKSNLKGSASSCAKASTGWSSTT